MGQEKEYQMKLKRIFIKFLRILIKSYSHSALTACNACYVGFEIFENKNTLKSNKEPE